MTQTEQLAALLKASRSAVFFGGAGVSTESSVKDYRSKDGLYQTVKEYGVSPETILSHTYLFSHPDIFYDFFAKYFLRSTAQPNKAHRVLADLERAGHLAAIVTQNIDGLHQAAGSKNVLELHGTADVFFCAECHRPYPKEKVKALDGQVPRCEHCGGLIRPKVTMYEEALDDAVTEKAIDAIANADLLLIGGTSLAVYPAAAYLEFFRGEHTVLINRDETPYDKRAELVIHESIGQTLAEAWELMQ